MRKFFLLVVLLTALSTFGCNTISSMITIDQVVDSQEQTLIDLSVSTQLLLFPSIIEPANQIAGMYLAVLQTEDVLLSEYDELLAVFTTKLDGTYSEAELALIYDMYTVFKNVIILKIDELGISDNVKSITVLTEAVMQSVYDKTTTLVTYRK